jgi:hypothetical protein
MNLKKSIVRISVLSSDPRTPLPVFNALIRRFDKLCIHPEIWGNVNFSTRPNSQNRLNVLVYFELGHNDQRRRIFLLKNNHIFILKEMDFSR